MIHVNTPSRLHLALIDLNAQLGRVDGGIGITLDEPGVNLTAEKATGIDASAGDQDHAERARDAATTVIRALDIDGGASIQLEGVPAHVGLGSGTQVSLAAGMAVCHLYDRDVGIRRIAEIVGRGGTSGIGVAAFEGGGFILDGGHRWENKGAFSPSAASTAPPPPVLLRRDFPVDWELVLAVPSLSGAHGQREVDIFKEYCPIPIEEVREVSHVILMKMLPALAEEDPVGFGDAIDRIQSIGFKRREVELQSPVVRRAMRAMRDAGAYGVGMSSFGPTLYALAEDPGSVMGAAEDVLGECTMVTRARNTGARIWES